jgi:hypothetical protein
MARTGQVEFREIVGLHDVGIRMMMRRTVVLVRRVLVREAGVIHRHPVAPVGFRRMLQLARADTGRTHRGANGRT